MLAFGCCSGWPQLTRKADISNSLLRCGEKLMSYVVRKFPVPALAVAIVLCMLGAANSCEFLLRCYEAAIPLGGPH